MGVLAMRNRKANCRGTDGRAVGSVHGRAATQQTPERNFKVIVRDDFIGPPILFPYEGSLGGVTYMVSPDGGGNRSLGGL